jgi:hypothetical protein
MFIYLDPTQQRRCLRGTGAIIDTNYGGHLRWLAIVEYILPALARNCRIYIIQLPKYWRYISANLSRQVQNKLLLGARVCHFIVILRLSHGGWGVILSKLKQQHSLVADPENICSNPSYPIAHKRIQIRFSWLGHASA